MELNIPQDRYHYNGDNIMSVERITFEEMTEKYPDQWLFIIYREHSENTELLSGVVFAHNE